MFHSYGVLCGRGERLAWKEGLWQRWVPERKDSQKVACQRKGSVSPDSSCALLQKLRQRGHALFFEEALQLHIGAIASRKVLSVSFAKSRNEGIPTFPPYFSVRILATRIEPDTTCCVPFWHFRIPSDFFFLAIGTRMDYIRIVP